MQIAVGIPSLVLVASASSWAVGARGVSAFQHHGGGSKVVLPLTTVSRPLHVPVKTNHQQPLVSQGIMTPRVSTSRPTTSSTSLQMAGEVSAGEKRIIIGHQISGFLFMAVAVLIMYLGLNGPMGWGLPMYAASGPYLAAGISVILADAAQAGRLGSATYKRLALFQTEFNLCGLSTILLALGSTVLREQLFYGLSLASLLSLSPSLAGYKYGEPNIFSETGAFIKGMFTCKNLNSFIYLAGTWFVATLKVLKLVEMINLVMEGNPAKTIVTRAVRFGRLALLTGVMFTLKDASDRERLEGSTFIDLNFLSSIVLGTMAFYIKTIRGAMTPLVWTTSGFAAFTALNGFVSLAKKSKK